MIDIYAEKINTVGVLEKADFIFKYYKFIFMIRKHHNRHVPVLIKKKVNNTKHF